jgi:hypothetical protein
MILRSSAGLRSWAVLGGTSCRAQRMAPATLRQINVVMKFGMLCRVTILSLLVLDRIPLCDLTVLSVLPILSERSSPSNRNCQILASSSI